VFLESPDPPSQASTRPPARASSATRVSLSLFSNRVQNYLTLSEFSSQLVCGVTSLFWDIIQPFYFVFIFKILLLLLLLLLYHPETHTVGLGVFLYAAESFRRAAHTQLKCTAQLASATGKGREALCCLLSLESTVVRCISMALYTPRVG
jgi:hypothetical protein